MTRRHFERLAWELRQRYPEPGPLPEVALGSDWYAGMVRGWEAAVEAAIEACRAFNPAFDSGRFAMAAGIARRPDGSMFPTAAPR